MVTEISGVSVDPSTDGYGASLSPALPSPENGWLLHPFQIVSLLDVIEFEAREFFGILNRLISVRKYLEEKEHPPLTDSQRVDMHGHADRAELVCAKYDIDVSYYTDRLRQKIDDPERFTFTIASAVNDVRHCINNELRNRKFMYMPEAEAKYYDQNDLFGEDVDQAFPVAQLDIRSVGNCIACGLFTASVFHSMRVAEFGLRRIAAKLRVRIKDHKGYVPVEYGTWDKVAKACKGKIDKIRQRPIGPKREAELELYSDAADHCLFMKDIWRNNVSHNRKPYNEPESLAVLERVKDFMKFLAANVS
jgi:hypothetical protein